MKTFSTVATYILIGIIVICLGALAGWYFVLRSKNGSISSADAARGFGNTIPSANQNGSTFQNGNATFSEGGNASGNSASGSLNDGAGGSNGSGNENSNVAGESSANDSGNMGSPAGSVNANSAGIKSATSSVGGGKEVMKPQTPRLWHVSKTPVAGAGFGSATSSQMFYAERLGGYIFRANLFTGEILRLSNTLKPKSYEASFSRTGAVILRTQNEKTGDAETFSGSVSSSTSSAPGTLLGTDMRKNLIAISADADGATLFYTMHQSGTGIIGVISTWSGTKEKRVFASPLESWRPILLADGRTIIVQKPHDSVLGYAYEVKKGEVLEPLVRAIPGLTILPIANTNALLYGSSDAAGLQLFLTRTGTSTFALPIRTIADKCVWAPYPAKIPRGSPPPQLIAYCAVPDQASVSFLSKWYRGEIHPSDSWWKIDGKTREVTQIFSPATQNVSLDVIDPQIDPSGNFISFKNNNDSSLWVFRIMP